MCLSSHLNCVARRIFIFALQNQKSKQVNNRVIEKCIYSVWIKSVVSRLFQGLFFFFFGRMVGSVDGFNLLIPVQKIWGKFQLQWWKVQTSMKELGQLSREDYTIMITLINSVSYIKADLGRRSLCPVISEIEIIRKHI